MDRLDFFISFLRDPMVAAISPSSRYVVEKVLKNIDFKRVSAVIEYGSGDGIVTKEVLKRLRLGGRFFAFEPNEELFQQLKMIKDNRLVAVKDLAENSQRYVKGDADLILASIPFSKISRRSKLLRAMSQELRDDGRLIIYAQHNPVRLRKDLPKHFSKVEMQFEPRNFPPCFIFVCQEPLRKINKSGS